MPPDNERTIMLGILVALTLLVVIPTFLYVYTRAVCAAYFTERRASWYRTLDRIKKDRRAREGANTKEQA